jgi:mono/diheme cytochrome c family protein
MRKILLFAALVIPAFFAFFALSADAAAPDGGAPAAKVVGPPEVAWKDMTADQRGKYMKAVVTPKMKPVFQEFDGKMFAKFTCQTCHGKDAKERKFKMPSNDIKPLPSTPEAFQAALKTKPTWPKWTDFMAKKVEPQMATLLGMVPFDPKKPDPSAFSCAGCHKLEGKEGAKEGAKEAPAKPASKEPGK